MSSDKLKVNVNEYLPLRDVVFNTLRQAIITGEFVPGERLMEIALANRLGVSRTPVREAIRTLELEGLVVMIYRYRLEYVKDTAYHAVLLKEHEELVEAMFAGNKERAKEIMKRHIDNQEETVIKKIQEEEK